LRRSKTFSYRDLGKVLMCARQDEHYPVFSAGLEVKRSSSASSSRKSEAEGNMFSGVRLENADEFTGTETGWKRTWCEALWELMEEGDRDLPFWYRSERNMAAFLAASAAAAESARRERLEGGAEGDDGGLEACVEGMAQ
jgi:hypothetical protein